MQNGCGRAFCRDTVHDTLAGTTALQRLGRFQAVQMSMVRDRFQPGEKGNASLRLKPFDAPKGFNQRLLK